MIPIICIIGSSGAGKTTLIENLIPELKKRGYRIGVIKHTVHGFEIDRNGKDSYRLKKAGASLILISSPEKIALIKDVDKEYSLKELKKFIEDVDIVLVEGFKGSSYPKIQVFRKGIHNEFFSSDKEKLIAIVSDTKLDLKVPVFQWNQIEELADFIERRFLI